MSEIKIQIAESIQKECKKRNISLSRMAILCGVSKSTLHDWATIGKHPKLDKTGVRNLKKLADFMEISVAQLVFGTLEEKKAHVVFESTFRDGDLKYKFKIERILDT